MTLSASSQNSPHRHSTPESYLLDLLRVSRAHTVEGLLEEVTEFSWAQLFAVIDSLSCSGMIELRRDGLTYWLRKAGPWGSGECLQSSL
jgi:hypothetical protein